MSTPKFLVKFSSKGSSEDPPDGDPNAALPKEIPSEKLVDADLDIPQYPDAMKEAWSAVNVELPQAQGVEKFLNRVSMLTELVLVMIVLMLIKKMCRTR